MANHAPLYRVPAEASQGSPVIYDYALHQEYASRIHGYVKVRIALPVALSMAAASPYPDGVKVGVMKQISNNSEVTLQQMRILLGWAARRAQHTGRER